MKTYDVISVHADGVTDEVYKRMSDALFKAWYLGGSHAFLEHNHAHWQIMGCSCQLGSKKCSERKLGFFDRKVIKGMFIAGGLKPIIRMENWPVTNRRPRCCTKYRKG